MNLLIIGMLGVSIDLSQILLSAFQLPNPFGLALKSPNRGPVCCGGGVGDKIGSGRIETGGGGGGGLNGARIGEKTGPSLSDHEGARCPHGLAAV